MKNFTLIRRAGVVKVMSAMLAVALSLPPLAGAQAPPAQPIALEAEAAADPPKGAPVDMESTGRYGGRMGDRVDGGGGSERVIRAADKQSLAVVFNGACEAYLMADHRVKRKSGGGTYTFPIKAVPFPGAGAGNALHLYLSGMAAKDAGTEIVLTIKVNGCVFDTIQWSCDEVKRAGEAGSFTVEKKISRMDALVETGGCGRTESHIAIDINIALRRVGKSEGFALVDLHQLSLSIE